MIYVLEFCICPVTYVVVYSAMITVTVTVKEDVHPDKGGHRPGCGGISLSLTRLGRTVSFSLYQIHA